MIWIEIVCDECNRVQCGEYYREGSVTRIKADAKANGWKTINGKMYCPNCFEKLKEKNK